MIRAKSIENLGDSVEMQAPAWDSPGISFWSANYHGHLQSMFS